jgi:hypothetical protein
MRRECGARTVFSATSPAPSGGPSQNAVPAPQTGAGRPRPSVGVPSMRCPGGGQRMRSGRNITMSGNATARATATTRPTQRARPSGRPCRCCVTTAVGDVNGRPVSAGTRTRAAGRCRRGPRERTGRTAVRGSGSACSPARSRGRGRSRSARARRAGPWRGCRATRTGSRTRRPAARGRGWRVGTPRGSRRSRRSSRRPARRSVLELAGAHALLDVVAAVRLEHHRVDPAQRQQEGQHQPGGTRPHAYLGLHPRRLSD